MSIKNSLGTREVNIFRNRNNQAIRIPMEFMLDADAVRISRDGEHLILGPIHKNGLVALLDTWHDLFEDVPIIGDERVEAEDFF